MIIKTQEDIARNETFCRGCGDEKKQGCIICWSCFKYRKDIIPFKYFDGSFEDWLKVSLESKQRGYSL